MRSVSIHIYVSLSQLQFTVGHRRRVTWPREAGDWGFGGGRLILQTQLFIRACVEMSYWQSVLWQMQNPGSPNGPPTVDDWVVHLSCEWSVNLLRPWNQLKTTNVYITECCPLNVVLKQWEFMVKVLTMPSHDVWQTWPKPWQKCFTVTILRAMFATRTYDISASVESSTRFPSEIFYAKAAKAKDFIGRHTDHT